jgi:thiol-disulfide isomerase/thioredoxin
MSASTRALPALMLPWLLVGVGSQHGAADSGDAKPLPRYHLETGQELTYKGESQFRYGNGTSTSSLGQKSEWKVWIVRKNDDGSHRLVIRSTESRMQDGQAQGTPDSTLAYCDVFDDGRIVPNESLGYRLDPASLFPRLPEDEPQVNQGWEEVRQRDDGRSRFQVVSRPDSESNVWTFKEVRTSPMDEIYLSTHQSTATFDPRRGLVTRVESQSTQGFGFNGKGTGTVELASVETQDAASTERFREEADRYFEANKTYEELLRRASREAKSSQELLAQAKHALEVTREKIAQPVLKEQVDEQLKSHERMASYYAEEASRRAEVVGRPSADWETKDLEGKPHMLKDYRGKVVILDFWYRGCGWCIRAMPQVKQLAEDFRDQPVAVLGMNTDRNEEDAQFVVEKMGLRYPNLKAEGLPQKYGVRGFPTLVIIDPEGTVQDLHVGYSPTLRQEVAEVIKGLLEKQ